MTNNLLMSDLNNTILVLQEIIVEQKQEIEQLRIDKVHLNELARRQTFDKKRKAINQ